MEMKMNEYVYNKSFRDNCNEYGKCISAEDMSRRTTLRIE